MAAAALTTPAAAANTASTAETIAGVRSHRASVEDHLRFQNDQHVIALRGQRVSMQVYGEGWNDEGLVLNFVVTTPPFVLTGIDLLNGGELSPVVSNAF
jgi:hypothetical protein